MGSAVFCYAKLADGADVDLVRNELPAGVTIRALTAGELYGREDGATHEVDFGVIRFYSQNHQLGPAGKILGALMALHSCSAVEDVWYGSAPDEARLFTRADVLELAAYFMENGRRPYAESMGPAWGQVA